MKRKWSVGIGAAVLLLLAGVGGFFWYYKAHSQTRDEALEHYMSLIEKGEYEQMYEMLDEQSKAYISREDFVDRNRKIYDGIEASNVKITVTLDEKERALKYNTEMMTVAGKTGTAEIKKSK